MTSEYKMKPKEGKSDNLLQVDPLSKPKKLAVAVFVIVEVKQIAMDEKLNKVLGQIESKEFPAEKLVYADVLDHAVVPPPVAFAQTVLDGVADGAPRYAVFLRQRLHRNVCRAGKQLLRKQSCDVRVLVCCEGDALVRDGPAIATDYLSDRHYETDLAFPVRQPDERSVSVSVCTDVARPAFGAVCVRRP